jgi:hypothetical protein
LAQEVDAIANSISVTPHQFVLPYKTIRNCPIHTPHKRQVQVKNLTMKSDCTKKKEFKEINKQTELAGESKSMQKKE